MTARLHFALVTAIAGGLAVACDGERIEAGLDEPFVVHDAQFFEGILPGAPESGPPENPRPTSATTELTALRPLIANVPFSGWVTEDAVAVGAQIAGQGTGYWIVPAGPLDPAVPGSRSFRFIADLNAGIPPGRHQLLVSAFDAAGRPGSRAASTVCVHRLVPDNGNVCDPARPPPEFVVSLAWDRPVDLDIAVVTPSGAIVSPRTPAVGLTPEQKIDRKNLDQNPEGVGFLDHDSNENCVIDGRQLENVVFFQRPAPGVYLVYVNLQSACGEQNVHYSVTRSVRGGADAPGTFGVYEVSRTSGTLVALQANGGSAIGTFVTEFVVP